MTLYRTVAPTAEPVSLAEAKAELRLSHDSEDATILGLIRAAREEVERATGLALLEQRWRLALDRWPANGLVLLKRAPVIAVNSVTVYGADGGAALLDPDTYQLDAAPRPARLQFTERPAPERRMNGIEIDFVTGFGAEAGDVPELLRRTILMLVAHWFEFRAMLRPEDQPSAYPAGYAALVGSFRARSL